MVAVVAIAAALAVAGSIAKTSTNDFFVFLNSAHWLREGADLYQHPLRAGPGYNLNPPAALLVFLPFSYLSDANAFLAWTAVSLGAYLLAAYWITRTLAPGRLVSIGSLLLVSQPVIIALLLGQTAALVMLLMTAAWMADRSDRTRRAGVLLGTAIALKPFLGVFLAYALWRRSRPFVAGMAMGIGGTAIIGLAVGGVSGYRSWLAALHQISWIAHWLNGSLLGFFTRTLSDTPEVLHMTPVAVRPHLVYPLWYAAVVSVVAVSARALLRTHDRDRAWSLLLVASLLISPLGWMYYLPSAAGPLVAVMERASRGTRALIGVGYACLLIPPSAMPTLGALQTALSGSVYTWAVVLWFAGLSMSSRQLTGRRWAAG